MKNKIIALLICGIMGLSLVACGSASGDAASAESKTESAGEETENDETAEDDGDEANEAEDVPDTAADTAQGPASEITYTNARTWVDSIGTVWVRVISEIKNIGDTPLYLSSGAYDLEDASGNLLESNSYITLYPDIIQPGESAFLYDETILDDADEAIEVKALPRYDFDKAKVDVIRFPITDEKIGNKEYGGLKMVGRIENTSDEDQDMVYIAAKLYDAEGNPMGVISTILMETLKAGDKIGFEAYSMSLPSDITAESVASYEVLAYPLQYQF